MALDVARIRGLFPALGDGWIHLDTPAGMQIPDQVATAVSTALRAPVSGLGGVFPASQRAASIVEAARRSIADLVGADPAGVVLGPSSAVLLRRLADALSVGWLIGDEVVVSRLDDPANTVPWLAAVQRCGGTARWAEIDIETCELPAWQYDELVTPRTKVVAITAASGAVGTRPELQRISEVGREAGALIVVDASAAAPFLPIDVTTMGADIVVVSANAWGGPPLAAMVFRDAAVLGRLASCSLDPAAHGPERLELGPQPYPMLAGLVASVDYLAELDDAALGPRRERLLTSMGSMKAYQAGLLANLISELRALDHVMVIGDAMRRVPALAFAVLGAKAQDTVEQLAERGICAFADSGQSGVFAALGIGEVGGAVRLGLAHYTNTAELDHLVQAVSELAKPAE
ncbi:MAG TPA: cysteine desulfurase-like protein [Pseudonocardiaceae bacterium]|jgi:cysteine desulfurase family protein (TIGR01976 family)|nr:cysteine desulfurase-like protein [Pseudonocardiaceae bacterium]